MTRIRAAYDQLRKTFGKHPFAHNEFYTDGREIIAAAADELGDEVLAGVVSRQQFFVQAKTFLKLIEYSSATHLAAKWNIAKGVCIDPSISLGKPVVAGTGTTTFVVARSYSANGNSAELVADLFQILPEDVRRSVEFEEGHPTRTAA
jgi:uncharacterized protein (DUF433 family)